MFLSRISNLNTSEFEAENDFDFKAQIDLLLVKSKVSSFIFSGPPCPIEEVRWVSGWWMLSCWLGSIHHTGLNWTGGAEVNTGVRLSSSWACHKPESLEWKLLSVLLPPHLMKKFWMLCHWVTWFCLCSYGTPEFPCDQQIQRNEYSEELGR